jgi:hypothetical protein
MGRYIYTGTTSVSLGAKKIYIRPKAGGASPYTESWTVPANITCATFEVWGGGGGGAPTCCCTCYFGNSGAGAGYTIKTVAVNPGDVYAVSVGQGGCGNQCWFNANACGCAGQKSFVTGNGLTNLCATGGEGGTGCQAAVFEQTPGLGYGGDYNFCGKSSHFTNCDSARSGCRSFHLGGSAPFGGGWQIASGSAGAQSYYVCGTTGTFPGGGGIARPNYSPGWCDCCSGCAGGGADGLVIITI